MSLIEAKRRWDELEELQKEYQTFDTFLIDVMIHLGFDITDVQVDIGNYLELGSKASMIQAERGIAKTTITAAYAVWTLIHNPHFRIVIVTASGDFSAKISTLVIKLITTMDCLECLRPETSNSGGGTRDRTSVKAFDVHSSLRREAEKDPSVACFGIGGSLTGARADLLIADDIETMNNSDTAGKRELLLSRISEFSDICTDGKIVFLGTPQTIDSIYNTLPSKGFDVRIWTGRYPTEKQLEHYGDHLAPFILNRIKKDPSLQTGGGYLGDQGQATDTRINERVLQTKEMQKGTAAFQLQYMLNTTLTDKMKYPLKTEDLIYMDLRGDVFPDTVVRNPNASSILLKQVAGYNFKIGSAINQDDVRYSKLTRIIMYIDPAGGGTTSNDETAYAVVGLLNSNIYILSIGGLAGGYEQDKLDHLAEIAEKYKPQDLIIEKNMGNGAFSNIFLPTLRKKHNCSVTDDWVSGQKEKRIADTLGPVIGRGSLILTRNALEDDDHYCEKHAPDKRKMYSLIYQMSKLTLIKNSLKHDDRLDALASAVAPLVKDLAIDQDAASEVLRRKERDDFLKRVLGYEPKKSKKNSSYLNKRMR